jgi:hypothetical protein
MIVKAVKVGGIYMYQCDLNGLKLLAGTPNILT